MTRNPLYVFSTIAAFGLGAQLGSLVFALLCAAATIAIFLLVISHEERALAQLFHVDYTPVQGRGTALHPGVRPVARRRDNPGRVLRLVRRTFFDALLFMFAIPLAQGSRRIARNS